MVTLGYRTALDAAHKLLDYEGKCAQLHGHTWKVQVELVGEVRSDGMVMDFHEVKEMVGDVVNKYDHQDLNLFFAQPTCENIAIRLFQDLTNALYHRGYKT